MPGSGLTVDIGLVCFALHHMKRFLAFSLVVAAVLARAGDLADQLAIQTWTLRNMKFEQVVEFAKAQGIKELQVIGSHIDPNGSKEDWETKKAALDAAGLKAYTFGVAGTSMDKEKNRRLFEFAKFMGMKLIIVEPGDFRIWDNLEELAKEYDIRVAVHNHGIRSLYGNPAVVRQIIQHRDPRIGVCMDIGWVASTGMDPAKVFKEYEGRVFDLHLKDKRIEKTQGDDVYFDTLIGEGRADMKKMLQTLKESGYVGRMAIETDSSEFAKDPTEFVAKAKAFVVEHGK
jgi:sugar phosphate isomerase/epimerase